MSCWDKYLSKAAVPRVKPDERVSNYLRDCDCYSDDPMSDDWYENYRKHRKAVEDFDSLDRMGASNYDFSKE